MEIVTALCKSVFKKIFLKGTYNWDISGMRMIPPALRATFLFKGGLFFYHVPLEKEDVPKGQGDYNKENFRHLLQPSHFPFCQLFFRHKHLPGLCALVGTDHAHLFQLVHHPGGTGIA